MPKLIAGLLGAGMAFLSTSGGRTDSPPPRVRQICDPALPENANVCIPDTFEVIFGTDKNSINSVLDYLITPPEEDIDVTIVTDTKSERVQGWSYGVEHDPSVLEILEATAGGTDADDGVSGGFVVTSIDVEKCDDLKCANRTKGGGFLSATLLTFKPRKPLVLQRNSLCRARYRLIQDAGCNGTYIGITNLMAAPGTPPVSINVTVDGRSKRWTNATDGWVRRHCDVLVETDCSDGADNDGDQMTDCWDADCHGAPACDADELGCYDGSDNDGDGMVGCADEDCAHLPECWSEAICDDGQDNDFDGTIDCDDDDCAGKPCGPSPGEFNRADADGNGKHNLFDTILVLRTILGDHPLMFDCQDMVDANDDGTLGIVDVLPLLEWVFRDGPDLPAPFRACGRDETGDALDCNESNCG